MSDPNRKIIEAALPLFQNHAPEDVSLSQIDQTLNASDGYTFHYYESKKTLMEDCVEYTANQTIEQCTEILNHSELGICERLEQMMAQIKKQADFMHRLQRDGKRNTRGAADFAVLAMPLYQNLTRALKNFIEEGIEKDVFHTENPEMKASFITYGLYGLRCNCDNEYEKMHEFYNCMTTLLCMTPEKIRKCA